MNYKQINYRLIITGGPGSGKTTLINKLKESGFNTFPEIARDLISKGAKPPIRSSNERNNKNFFYQILTGRISMHQSAPPDKISFYDRGLADSLAFFKFRNIKPPIQLLEAINEYRYNDTVIIIPPLKDLFSNDFERQESFEEAMKLYEYIREAYSKSAYSLMELKEVSVKSRIEEIFIILKGIGLIEQ